MRLNERQTDMLEFINTHIGRNGYPPTVREIQKGCDISSTSVVTYNLDKLVNAGKITREPERSRSIALVEKEPELEVIMYLPEGGELTGYKRFTKMANMVIAGRPGTVYFKAMKRSE